MADARAGMGVRQGARTASEMCWCAFYISLRPRILCTDAAVYSGHVPQCASASEIWCVYLNNLFDSLLCTLSQLAIQSTCHVPSNRWLPLHIVVEDENKHMYLYNKPHGSSSRSVMHDGDNDTAHQLCMRKMPVNLMVLPQLSRGMAAQLLPPLPFNLRASCSSLILCALQGFAAQSCFSFYVARFPYVLTHVYLVLPPNIYL